MDVALEFLSSFLPYIMRFNLYSWLFLAGALVLFVLIFVLGMMLSGAARKILIIFACMIPTVAPFLLEFASKKMLMPVDVNLSSRTLTYAPTFFISGTITLTGKLPIKTCIMTTKLNPPPTNAKSKLLAVLKPQFVDKLTLNGPFVLGEPMFVQHSIGGITTEMVADIDVSCY